MTRDGKRFILVQSSTHRTDSAQDRSRIQVWDLETRTELSAGEIPGGRVSVWGIDPDGQTLVLSRLQRPRPLKIGDEVRSRLSFWDLSNNREVHGADVNGSVNGAVMSPDGIRVAWALSLGGPKFGNELRVWEAKTGREEWSRGEWGDPAHTARPGTPMFSRDGGTLEVATEWGSGKNQCYVLDAANGRDRVPALYSSEGALRDLRISDDGRRLFALASEQKNIPMQSESAVVWDLVAARKLLTLPADAAIALTIDREGRRIYMVKEFLGSGKLELETFDGSPLAEP
jgi:WD40 repeat protein